MQPIPAEPVSVALCAAAVFWSVVHAALARWILGATVPYRGCLRTAAYASATSLYGALIWSCCSLSYVWLLFGVPALTGVSFGVLATRHGITDGRRMAAGLVPLIPGVLLVVGFVVMYATLVAALIANAR